jgi:hypothetical protein
MPKSTYTAHNHINATYRGIGYTSPTTIYIALYTVMPTVAGGGTEVTGGSYNRQVVTFGAPSGGAASNSNTVTFTTASANWGTIVGYGYFDASTVGNLLSFSTLSASRVVNTGDQVVLDIGQLTCAET